MFFLSFDFVSFKGKRKKERKKERKKKPSEKNHFYINFHVFYVAVILKNPVRACNLGEFRRLLAPVTLTATHETQITKLTLKLNQLSKSLSLSFYFDLF